MDPEILAALIGAGATVGVGGAPLGIQMYRNRKKARLLAAQSEALKGRGPESIYSQCLAIYGYQANVSHSFAKITNADGDAQIARGFQDLEVTKKDLYIPALTHRSEGTGKYKSPPTLRVVNSAGLTLKKGNHWSSGSSSTVVNVQFAPNGLGTGKKLTYYLDVESERALKVRRSEIDAAYKDDSFQMEYFGGRAQMPSKKLVVEAEFPEGMASSCHSVIFLPKSEVVAPWVDEACKPRLIQQGRTARLEVEYPLIDFAYAIAWPGC